MRTLELVKVITDFEGKPVAKSYTTDEAGNTTVSEEFTLRDGLLTYLRNAHDMGVSDAGLNDAYIIGLLVGDATQDTVELSTAQYDFVKRLCDNGKVTLSDGSIKPLFNSLEVRLAVKYLVDSAKVVEKDAK